MMKIFRYLVNLIQEVQNDNLKDFLGLSSAVLGYGLSLFSFFFSGSDDHRLNIIISVFVFSGCCLGIDVVKNWRIKR